MLLLNMTLAIVLPWKAGHRIRTGHVRTRVRDRSELLGVRTFLVSFEIVSLAKSRDMIRAVRYWALVRSKVVCSTVLTKLDVRNKDRSRVTS
jgi:hypothetical protein